MNEIKRKHRDERQNNNSACLLRSNRLSIHLSVVHCQLAGSLYIYLIDFLFCFFGNAFVAQIVSVIDTEIEKEEFCNKSPLWSSYDRSTIVLVRTSTLTRNYRCLRIHCLQWLKVLMCYLLIAFYIGTLSSGHLTGTY